MSAVRVAPMKTPSSWNAHTPAAGIAAAHTRYSRAASARRRIDRQRVDDRAAERIEGR